jgi:uncharacterized phiE125 gp8 family phage protein
MTDLTTLDSVKAWLKITGTSDDALLKRLITASTQFITQWLNRDIFQQSYTESRNGTGGTRMSLANYPVTAVASLSIDGTTIPVSTDYTVNGYVFDSQQIMLRGYRFNRGFQNVVLTYTAGYVAVPAELEQACIELLSLRYKERDRIGMTSTTVNGNETAAYFTGDMPKSVQTMLQNWKRVIPV